MFGSTSDNVNSPQIVILTGDYGLNARLQQSFQKLNWQSLGFYFVEDAIEWEELQTNKEKLFIIDHDINGISWKEAIRAFHRNNLAIDSLVLIKPGEDVTTREVKQHGAIGVVDRDESVFDVLPGKLDKLIRIIRSEYEQPAVNYQADLLKDKDNDNDDEKDHPHHVKEQTPITKAYEYNRISLDEHKKQLEQLKTDLTAEHDRERANMFLQLGFEMREDVGAVLNKARSLKNTPLDEKQKDLLASIIHAAGELVVLSNNLVDHDRIESKKAEVIYHNFHLKAMIYDVVELYRHRAEKKNINIEVTIHDRVPGYIYADKLKIQQVIVNLMRWMIKKTHDCIAEFTVQIVSDQTGLDQLRITIGKKGVDTARRVNLSVQAYNDTLAVVNSDMDIGLKNAKGLAFIMGGELILTNDDKSGYSACFTIPLMESEAAVAAQDLNQGYSTQKQHLRVLLAEDDVINQMYLAGFLRLQGWDVDTAYNGLVVLELFEQDKYDLIILDGQMPGMNGFDAARKIRSSETNDNRIPIIAISGYAIPGDKQKFLDAGMDDYLPKPINEDELLSVIRKLTRK